MARAGADAARCGYGLRDVRAFLADIVQRGFAGLNLLEEEARLGPKAHSTLLRQVLKELRTGVRSAPEAELRTLVECSAILPPVRWNPRPTAGNARSNGRTNSPNTASSPCTSHRKPCASAPPG